MKKNTNKGLINVPKRVMQKFYILRRTMFGETISDIEDEIKDSVKNFATVEYQEGFYPASSTNFIGWKIKFTNYNYAKECEKRLSEIFPLLEDFIQTNVGIEKWDNRKLAVGLSISVTYSCLNIMANIDDLSSFKGSIMSDEYFPYEYCQNKNNKLSPILGLTLGGLIHLVPLYILNDINTKIFK